MASGLRRYDLEASEVLELHSCCMNKKRTSAICFPELQEAMSKYRTEYVESMLHYKIPLSVYYNESSWNRAELCSSKIFDQTIIESVCTQKDDVSDFIWFLIQQKILSPEQNTLSCEILSSEFSKLTIQECPVTEFQDHKLKLPYLYDQRSLFQSIPDFFDILNYFKHLKGFCYEMDNFKELYPVSNIHDEIIQHLLSSNVNSELQIFNLQQTKFHEVNEDSFKLLGHEMEDLNNNVVDLMENKYTLSGKDENMVVEKQLKFSETSETNIVLVEDTELNILSIDDKILIENQPDSLKIKSAEEKEIEIMTNDRDNCFDPPNWRKTRRNTFVINHTVAEETVTDEEQRGYIKDFLGYLYDEQILTNNKCVHYQSDLIEKLEKLEKIGAFKNTTSAVMMNNLLVERDLVMVSDSLNSSESIGLTFTAAALNLATRTIDQYKNSELHRCIQNEAKSTILCKSSSSSTLSSVNSDSSSSSSPDGLLIDFLCYIYHRGYIFPKKRTIVISDVHRLFRQWKIESSIVINKHPIELLSGNPRIAYRSRFKITLTANTMERVIQHHFFKYKTNIFVRNDNITDFLCYLQNNGLISIEKPGIEKCLLMKTFDDLKNRQLFQKLSRDNLLCNIRSHQKPLVSFASDIITLTRHGFRVIEENLAEYVKSSKVHRVTTQIGNNVENLNTPASLEFCGLTTAQKKFLNYVDNELTVRHIHTYIIRSIDPDFIPSSFCCRICRLNFNTEYLLENHIKEHIMNKIDTPSSAITTICHFSLTVQIEPDSLSIKFLLKNLRLMDTKINQIIMFTASSTVEIWEKSRFPMDVVHSQVISFGFSRYHFCNISHGYQIFVHFECDGRDFVERHDFVLNERLPSTVVDFPDSFDINNRTTITRTGPLRMTQIDQYVPSLETSNIMNADFISYSTMSDAEILLLESLNSFASKGTYERLNPQNYVITLRRLVEIEDVFCAKMMFQFDKREETLTRSGGNYTLAIANLSEHRPSLLPYDEVVVTPEKLQPDVELEKQQVEGCIKRCGLNDITLQLDRKIDCKLKYRIHFKMNRKNFRLEHRALEIVNRHDLSSFLFPETVPQKIGDKNLSLQWFNKNIETNPEQKQAVTNIVLGLAHPLPYIIFGPPGTGKTMTVVEAITQLYTVYPSSRILITTGSNAACNEITSRLLKFVPGEDMLRMFSVSQEVAAENIDNDIIKVSNLHKGIHYYPSIEVITGYRIILSTISVAGKLIQASINPRHFTHVFIDECGSIPETMAIIPIAGMVTTHRQIHANLIIAGDPLQLGPIINSKRADKLGLGISMLDRLMNSPVYQRDPDKEKYNTQIITKLLINYRSHPAILKTSNDLFYNGELKAFGLEENINWALNWKLLPNPKIPIILNVVHGEMLRETNSPSWFNMQEFDRLKFYLNVLLRNGVNGKRIVTSDIGIVSPYRKQCQKIRQYLSEKRWENIEVASVEAFQGREKPVILISTVRSNTRSLGFLNNEKRLNVLLTRAKALMIVIGDPRVLQIDLHWRNFIKYCVLNRCCYYSS